MKGLSNLDTSSEWLYELVIRLPTSHQQLPPLAIVLDVHKRCYKFKTPFNQPPLRVSKPSLYRNAFII
jgi:hypothetical protein